MPSDAVLAPLNYDTRLIDVPEGVTTIAVPVAVLPADCPDPVGIAEIAARHQTTPGTIRSWRNRHGDFPEPIAQLAMGPLFSWQEVEEWLRTRG